MTASTPSDDAPQQRLVCRWCHTPLTDAGARWWDDRPECLDAHACTARIPRRTP